MSMLVQCLLLVLGFVLLIKGSDWFVEGSSGIATRFGIPQLVIGLTIVAMGTSAPEAAVSISAALADNAGISIGNVVGSNILNIFIILGISSVIAAITVSKSTIKYEIPYMIIITMLFFVFGYTGGEITFIEGILLWVAFIAYLTYLFMMARNNKEENEEAAEIKKTGILILLTFIGLALIILGSNVTVDAASAIATTLGISERFIGLTIVALGTSLPELFTSVTAAMKGKCDIAIGNIVGSNIFNILFVIGTSALITSIPFEANFLIDTIISAVAGVMLLLFVLKSKKLTRTGGICMLLAYVAYFIYLLQQ